jgi:hypothetical protein
MAGTAARVACTALTYLAPMGNYEEWRNDLQGYNPSTYTFLLVGKNCGQRSSWRCQTLTEAWSVTEESVHNKSRWSKKSHKSAIDDGEGRMYPAGSGI